jgi:predicted kinase
MPTLHLISGLPCSGKTTYSRRLHESRDSVLFTLDQWLITLFGRYSIADVGHDEHVRRVLACRELIWTSGSELLRRGVDVILDDGFFWRANRIQFIERARASGAATTTHVVSAPLDIVRDRLRTRNAHLPEFNFWIDENTLDQFVGLYEAPAADEGAEIIRVENAAADA